tara:strand:+ start:174 stop:683 length:510 start_codon:yes stop_codon:yes gene_type:complete
MCNDKYNLKIICNPDTPSTMKFRMPTSPMDRKMESFNGRCIYRILNVVRDSTEAGLDNKTLLIEFRIPTQNCYIKELTGELRVQQLQFMIPLHEGSKGEDRGDYISNTDPMCLGNQAWGNEVEVIFKTINKGNGAIASFGTDTIIAFELEVEPYDDMYEKMEKMNKIGM